MSSGCTVTRYAESGSDNRSVKPDEILKNIQKNNLSEENYFIEKGTILLNMNNEKQRLLFSIKFQKPQKYLISVRNSAGMEGARILISEDTLIINDRINKRILFGEPKDIERIAGFNAEMINTLFGDFMAGDKYTSAKLLWANTGTSLEQSYEGKVIRYVLDLKINKILSLDIYNSKTTEINPVNSLVLSYSKFKRSGKHIPGNIEVKDIGRNLTAKLKIEKLQTPWDGEIEFVPGKDYKSERIK